MIMLQQMIVLFLIMLVGFWSRKKGLLDDHASKKISGIVINIANPALILSASLSKDSTIEGSDLVMTFMIAIVLFASLVLMAHFLPMVLRVPKRDYGIYKAMIVFSNIGFMGFPVISAVYGSEALLYASLFLIPFNILIYTYGIQVMRPATAEKEPFQLKKVLNIGVIACILSLVIYLFKIPTPKAIDSTITLLSNLTAPLSMMVIGDSMTKMNLKELVTDTKLIIFSMIKLVLIPLAGVAAIKLLGVNPMLTGVCMIMLSTPVGSMTAMLAQQYDGDFELASRGVALTTLLSVLSMPLISAITGV